MLIFLTFFKIVYHTKCSKSTKNQQFRSLQNTSQKGGGGIIWTYLYRIRHKTIELMDIWIFSCYQISTSSQIHVFKNVRLLNCILFLIKYMYLRMWGYLIAFYFWQRRGIIKAQLWWGKYEMQAHLSFMTILCIKYQTLGYQQKKTSAFQEKLFRSMKMPKSVLLMSLNLDIHTWRAISKQYMILIHSIL